jgi:peptidoglycan L-alanyl-D-glutamate endopeptidase CwlK
VNKTSRTKLEACHINIIRLALAVDAVYPIQCVCGWRNDADQQKAFDEGKSKLLPGKSKHNKKPSEAGDFVPDPDRNPATIDWNDAKAFETMCLVFEQKADELGIKIRLGRDFKFRDMPHVELV